MGELGAFAGIGIVVMFMTLVGAGLMRLARG